MLEESKMSSKKKHEKIRAEIQRMERFDDQHCDINDCAPTEYMNGKKRVYVELLKFIDNL